MAYIDEEKVVENGTFSFGAWAKRGADEQFVVDLWFADEHGSTAKGSWWGDPAGDITSADKIFAKAIEYGVITMPEKTSEAVVAALITLEGMNDIPCRFRTERSKDGRFINVKQDSPRDEHFGGSGTCTRDDFLTGLGLGGPTAPATVAPRPEPNPVDPSDNMPF